MQAFARQYLCCMENSDRWNHFLQFKDYLSINTDRLKIQYAETRVSRTICNLSACVPSGKTRFMQNIMVEATDYFTLGHEITVVLDEEQQSGEYFARL